MKDSNAISAQTEGRVLASLIKAGYVVAIPFGVTRYDLIIETDSGFQRVQCKTGRLQGDVVAFNAYSLGTNRRPGHTTKNHYIGDADFFGVYCPGNDAVYLVPVDDRSRTEVYLRLVPAKNSQTKGVRWAADYELR